MEIKIKGVKITERGWAGHFCLAHKCMFHRNTLLEKGDVKIVVSSVGKLPTKRGDQLEEIGCDRYYETMVFFVKDDKWQDADVMRGKIACYSPKMEDPWDEMPANLLHDKIVEEFLDKMGKNEKIQTIDEIEQ